MNENYALISVFDKSKLKYLCQNLKKYNYKFISTGSTYKKIKSYGYQCIQVSNISKTKEMLDGRVKTIDSKLYASILYKRNNIKHIRQFRKLGIPEINLVVINFYPFSKFKKNETEEKTIDMIDIGGPSIIRAAAKNYNYLTAISDIEDYKNLVENLNRNNGSTDILFRKKMSSKVFKVTSNYDKLISEWFNRSKSDNQKTILRYGENPNQNAFILNKKFNFDINFNIRNKSLSYNNILDVDSGFKCLNEFNEPTCIIIKHNNPCGVASAKSINLAFKKSYESDSKSAFGGVVLLNKKVSKELAQKISKFFFEIIVAPKYDDKAIDIFSKKKKLILLKSKNMKISSSEFRSTILGTVHQKKSQTKINSKFLSHVGYKKISKKFLNDLIFALKVVKHVNSNAIVLCSNKQTIGIGMGKTNRVDSLKDAIKNYKRKFKNKDFVCSSDGFFPFTDGIEILKKNKCKALAQPSGSINDKKIIRYSKSNKLSLYFTKERLFKH